MAAKNTPAAGRAAVTLTGIALLQAIANSENGYLMLTQAEGSGIVSEGLAEVDTSIVDGDTAAVKLTEAGKAKVAEGGDTANTSTSFEIDDGVPLPTGTKRRGRESGYPFDKLQIGQSFHVAPTMKDGKLETPAEVVLRLSSSTSAARTKYLEEIPGQTEEYTKRTYKKDANGKFEKTADGKRILEKEEKATRPATKLTRDFMVKEVGEDDPKGPGARCWRIALAE